MRLHPRFERLLPFRRFGPTVIRPAPPPSLRLLALLGVMLVVTAGCQVNPAERSEDASGPYYEGKEIEIIVPFEEGGGTDIWARFIGPFLEKHIEGNPSITITNRSEGEGIVAGNAFAAETDSDGTDLLASSGTTVLHQLLGRPEVEYDFAELTPLVVTKSGGIMFANPETGIDSAEDLGATDQQLKYGAISPTGLDLLPLLVFELLDLDVKTVFGLEGRGPALLAFERGETTIDYQTTASYKSSVVGLVKENKAAPLFSFGDLAESGELRRDVTVPDVQTVAEAYEEATGRAPSGSLWDAYIAFMPNGFTYQKALWAHPDAPEEAVSAIEDAVRKMLEDPEFKKKSAEVMEGYPTFVGSDVEEEVIEGFDISDQTREFVRDFLADKYGVEF